MYYTFVEYVCCIKKKNVLKQQIISDFKVSPQ